MKILIMFGVAVVMFTVTQLFCVANGIEMPTVADSDVRPWLIMVAIYGVIASFIADYIIKQNGL